MRRDRLVHETPAARALRDIEDLAKSPPILVTAACFPSLEFTRQVFDYHRDLAAHTKSLCETAGIDTSGYLFDLPTYDEVLSREASISEALRGTGSGLPEGWSPKYSGDWTPLEKLLACAGIDSATQAALGAALGALGAVITDDLAFQTLVSMVRQRNWWEAIKQLGNLLDHIAGNEVAIKQTMAKVRKKLAEAAATAAAESGGKLAAYVVPEASMAALKAFLEKLASRAIPLIGWGLLIGDILSGLAAQAIYELRR